MTRVVYKGRDDVRVLAADDLKKAGVEGFRQMSFPVNVPVDVDDAVAEQLVNHELFEDFVLDEEHGLPLDIDAPDTTKKGK